MKCIIFFFLYFSVLKCLYCGPGLCRSPRASSLARLVFPGPKALSVTHEYWSANSSQRVGLNWIVKLFQQVKLVHEVKWLGSGRDTLGVYDKNLPRVNLPRPTVALPSYELPSVDRIAMLRILPHCSYLGILATWHKLPRHPLGQSVQDRLWSRLCWTLCSCIGPKSLVQSRAEVAEPRCWSKQSYHPRQAQ
jgi:hypothetical protein